MKQAFIIGMLFCLGLSQLSMSGQTVCSCVQMFDEDNCLNLPGCQWYKNQCNQRTCSSYNQADKEKSQKDCLLASIYCQWKNNLCSTFLGCQDLIASQPKDCISQNLQCLAFNPSTNVCQKQEQLTNQCATYLSQQMCNFNTGLDGPCFWVKNQCQPITQCSEINQQEYCESFNKKNNFICQWNGTCQKINSCSQYNTQESCRFYITKQSEFQINLCQWVNEICQPLQSTSGLTQNNCLLNTGYTYRWISSSINSNYGFCASCNPVLTPSRSLCQCNQFMLQSDCTSQGTLCQWNGQMCIQNQCQNILIIEECIIVNQCYWNYSVPNGNCQTLDTQLGCTSLPYQINSYGCAAQSLFCSGFSNGECQNLNQQLSCSQQLTEIKCQNYIGQDGYCVWINSLCVPLQFCEQIKNAGDCGLWQRNCSWNNLSQVCETLSCSQIKNKNQCNYVLVGFQESEYQICQYNTLQQKCQDIQQEFLFTSQVCNRDSFNTYRWSTNQQNIGMCLPCQQPTAIPIYINSSCVCQQFYQQENCENSGYCTYSIYNFSCSPKLCSNIYSKLECQTLPNCYWQMNMGCQNFISCSYLVASNQLECISMKPLCKGFQNGQCANYPTNSCSQIYQTSNLQECVNYIGVDGVCYLTLSNQTQLCQGFSNCSQADSQKFCELNQFTCYWLNNTCQQRTCQSYSNQVNCRTNFFFWNSKVNSCTLIQDFQNDLNGINCQVNTLNSYQSFQNSCLKCQLKPAFSQQCTCSELIYSFDCVQAQQCQWINNECAPLQCEQILFQTVCASQSQCAWIQGQCQNFSGQCSELQGTTSEQCMIQQQQCFGSKNNQCDQNLQLCENYTTEQNCNGALGKDGFCLWNTSFHYCFGVSSCQQFNSSQAFEANINIQYYCSRNFHSCISLDDECYNTSCELLYQYTGQCTYIQDFMLRNQIIPCYLVEIGENEFECYQAWSKFALDESTCSTNSNLTSRWNSQYCQSCAQIYISANLNNQTCQCWQYQNSDECQYNPPNGCVWNSNTQPRCQQMNCSQFQEQELCIRMNWCQWSQNKFCENFNGCTNILANSVKECLLQSMWCKGYNASTNSCQNNPNVYCSSFNSQSNCSGSIGYDGICFWNSSLQPSLCVGLQNCSQIVNQNICIQLKKYCYYQKNQCVNSSCNQFGSPALCTFIYKSLITGIVQMCEWNIQTSECQNRKSYAIMNQYTCAENTDYTYRWISNFNNVGGVCVSCNANVSHYYIPSQCTCNQLNIESDCLQNPYCIWNTKLKACQQIMCSQIEFQQLCSAFPKCFWSKVMNVCQPFTTCSDITAQSSDECASYSIYCAGPLQQQSQIWNNQQTCSPTKWSTCNFNNQYECEIQFPCFWKNSTCGSIGACYDIESQTVCQGLSHSCVWLGNVCQSASCASFMVQEDCTFTAPFTFYIGLLQFYEEITFCYWSGQCNQVTNFNDQLNQDNCYSNSMMLYRWISIPSQDLGYCVSCNQEVFQLNQINTCDCYLLDYQECRLAISKCVWNYEILRCTEINCLSIVQQNQCASTPKCVWNQYSYCEQFSKCEYQNYNEDQNQCDLETINCPISLGGGGCDQLSSCQTLQQNQCEINNLCYWNNSKCSSVKDCGQIKSIQLCNNLIYQCQWSFVLNQCIPQQCSSYIYEKQCNFVQTSLNYTEIALCQWNSVQHKCEEAIFNILSQYNSSNSGECYIKTGGTYYMNDTSCVQCSPQNLKSDLIVLLICIWVFCSI